MMKSICKTGFVAFALSAMMATAAYAKADDDAIAAIVNGDKIFKRDVLGAIKGLPVKPEDTDKVYPIVVDQMINDRLMDIETAKAQIEKDPEFQRRMSGMAAQLIKSMFLEKYLKDKVTEKAIKAEYDRFKKENKGKEEVHARHILVKTEEEAKQVIKDLDGGAKFEVLAKERSTGPGSENGGDIGYFAKGELIPEISDAAFNVKPGTYTKEPVKSQFGWHVVFVQDKRKRMVPEMKDVEAAIRNKLGQDAVGKLVQDLRAKADIQRFGMDGKPIEAPKKN